MHIKRTHNSPEFVAGDNSLLRELLHPDRDGVRIGYSIAVARVRPGSRTLWHRLKSSEVYYILRGRGIMQVNGESSHVEKEDLIYIPPGSRQRIENRGNEDLVFLCIVEPAWKKEDEEILE